MAYYIRKAFKSGPVRMNLSKGGIGFSMGVTGARVGLNSRGAYIHGGRHGLYYREQIGRKRKKKSTKPSFISDNSGNKYTLPDTAETTTSAVSLFRDTGETLGRPLWIKNPRKPLPVWAQPPIMPKHMIALAVVAAIFFLIGLTTPGASLSILNLLILIALGGAAVHGLIARRKCESVVINLEQIFAANSLGKSPEVNLQNAKIKTLDIREIVAAATSDIRKKPAAWLAWSAAEIHFIVTSEAIRSENISLKTALDALDEHLPLVSAGRNHLRQALIGAAIDDLLEDHLISDEEEVAARAFLDESGLGHEVLEREYDLILHYSKIREAIKAPFEAIDAGVSLVRGEVAYNRFELARVLNERILDRFQRDNVSYRVVGYEVELEGQAVITDRRLMIVGRGAREYRLNSIHHIYADVEAGVVELVIRERQTPVILTVDEPLLFAARLEMAHEKALS
jgi:hypothetical protein